MIVAPDISIDVNFQRTEREGTRWAAERWTTYTSPSDAAIGTTEWLYGGNRFGTAGYEDLDGLIRMWMENFVSVDLANRDSVIQYEGRRGGAFGHNYFRDNPAVSSDLVLTVRYGYAPGSQNGRPLDHVGGLFWKIGDDYLQSLNDK